MKTLPLVLWLVTYAAESVGWRVERTVHGDGLLVTEDNHYLTHKPRRWHVTAVETPDED